MDYYEDANAIETYHVIEKWYEEFLETLKAEQGVRAFDNALPDYAMIHPIKKVDTILWSIR